MSVDEVRNIFVPFGRSKNMESLERNPSGNGVGLSICKKICEALGGTIKVTSLPNIGSKFIFSIKVFNADPGMDQQQVLKKKKKPQIKPTKLADVLEESYCESIEGNE